MSLGYWVVGCLTFSHLRFIIYWIKQIKAVRHSTKIEKTSIRDGSIFVNSIGTHNIIDAKSAY